MLSLGVAVTSPVPPDFATPRDQHLFGPGPKRILALSGGGVRGALTVAFLKRLEEILDARHGFEVRLGDHFDLIGGTSTGALIAGALALGYRVDQIKTFYTEHAELAFQPRHWQLPVLQSKFDSHGLREQIASVIGERELGTPDLITGFCCITKRLDTGSVWMISNNPRAHYWEDGPDYIGNKHYSLANLVRASTAAPHYFDPEMLPITGLALPKLAEDLSLFAALLAEGAELLQTRRPAKEGDDGDLSQYGLFVDGGVSPYNNPSLALLQLATLKAHGIQWPMGPDQLSITSIGTGSYRPRLAVNSLGMGRVPKLAFHALLSMMADAEKQALTLLQWLGETPQPWLIDSEIGTLAGDGPPGGKAFRFHCYDVRLEEDWLRDELGSDADALEVAALRRMDDPAIARSIYAIGEVAAKRQIRPEDWA